MQPTALDPVAEAFAVDPDNPGHDLPAIHRTLKVQKVILDRLGAAHRTLKTAAADLLGAGGSHKAPALGYLTVSAPTRRAVVTDREAFTGWLATNAPDAVTDVERVNVSAVERALRDPDRRARLLDVVPDVAYVETLVDGEAADVIADRYARPDPDDPLQRRLGGVADDDGVAIPGLSIEMASKPTLSMGGLDRQARATLEAALVPATAEGDDDDR